MRLPSPYSWSISDGRLVGAHWSYDPGAEDFTREMSNQLGCPAIFARYSRLLLDPNRPIGSETMFRNIADGQTIELNAHISERNKCTIYDGIHM
jgi:predicted N-formylglutamate amidohydrolase